MIYDGSVKTVKVEAQGDAAVEGKIGAITVKYFKNNEGEGLEDASTDAGTYTVKISVAGGTDYAATSADLTDPTWTFTIAKAEQAAPKEELKGEAPTTQDGQGKIKARPIKMEYSTAQNFTDGAVKECSNQETEVTPGDYYVRYKEDNNHNPGTASDKITVPEYSGAEKPPTEMEIPEEVMSAITAYTGTYDGAEHDAITVGAAAKGYTVKYKVKGSDDFVDTVPQVKNVADCKEITVKVSKEAKSQEKKLTPSITAKDVTYTIKLEGKTYDGKNGLEKVALKAGTSPVTNGIIVEDTNKVSLDLSKAIANFKDGNCRGAISRH